MAEMNLKQINDKLNEEFTGTDRKLVFWYDSNGDFKDDIDGLELANAKIYRLEKDNQFKTKIFFEREDKTTNYLVYAPFAKPDIKNNHLEDTVRYSKEFFADLATLITLNLGIDESLKPVIKKYIKFFQNQTRVKNFKDLKLTIYNPSNIEIGLMAVLCKEKSPKFENIARCVLTKGNLEENCFLAEFSKYGLLEAFWDLCSNFFGYVSEKPTLTQLCMTIFATYAQNTVSTEFPKSLEKFISSRNGNITSFIEKLMYSYKDDEQKEQFEKLSKEMYKALDMEKLLKNISPEDLTECELFEEIDRIILKWLKERLLNEDTDAKLNGKSITKLCEERRKKRFGELYKNEYFVIENAWNIIKPNIYFHSDGMVKFVNNYTSEFYKTDRHYRYFYYFLDKLEDNSPYEELQKLVERIYANDFLNPLLTEYSGYISEGINYIDIAKQRKFYDDNLKYSKHRTAVIISDAMRYEVGISLYEKLQNDEKCSPEITVMQSILPSVTRLGMSALLPHSELKIIDADNALADDLPTIDLKQREEILKKANPKSFAIQFDELKNINNRDELRNLISNQDIIYIYHNQIDARGDKYSTENEVFIACEEAIEEISKLIRKLTGAGITYFIVTSDHGFIYKREKLSQSEKISGINGASNRFVITDEPISENGVCSVKLSLYSNSKDERYVNFPIGSDLFMAPGAGKNYVHGGCSPQEMLVPVIDVKTEKGKIETTNAGIELVSPLNKITNLITSLNFIQTEAVSDLVKEADYRIYFVSDNGDKISNEVLFTADKKETNSNERISRLKFSFKNQKYDKSHKYYLVVIEDQNGIEVMRKETIMDLAFADDFGF